MPQYAFFKKKALQKQVIVIDQNQRKVLIKILNNIINITSHLMECMKKIHGTKIEFKNKIDLFHILFCIKHAAETNLQESDFTDLANYLYSMLQALDFYCPEGIEQSIKNLFPTEKFLKTISEHLLKFETSLIEEIKEFYFTITNFETSPNNVKLSF